MFQFWQLKIITLTICTFLACLPSYAQNSPCPNIIIEDTKGLKLTDNEVTLVCGDPELQSYQNLPFYQIQYLLRGFLQSRGYLAPNFKIKDEKLYVDLGKQEKLKDVQIGPASKTVAAEIKRFHQNEIITPKRLDTIESTAKDLYHNQGIPCAKIKSQYDVQSSTVSIEATNLEKKRFGEVGSEKVSGLHPNAFVRYRPFKKEQLYDPKKLTLTEKRMLRAGVVQSTYFQKSCDNDSGEFSLSQKYSPGPKRTLRFGLGVSTEVGPMARLRWSNHRVLEMASLLQANLQGSLKEQSLRLTSDFYFDSQKPRRSLLSELEITRESESDYEQTSVQLGNKIKWQKDSQKHYWRWSTGPVIDAGSYKTDELRRSISYSSVSWRGSFLLRGHDYELFDLYPEEGHELKTDIDIRPKSWGLDYDLIKFDINYVKLHTLSKWGRGSLVAGFRALYQSTWIDDQTDPSLVPTNLRAYGGGSEDNRGYQRNGLPKNDGLGALTKGTLRLELRRTHFIGPRIEALVFTDLSQFSNEPWELDKPVWYSPGFGIRWLSPIGPIQTYAAQARNNQDSKKQDLYFFIGLGGQL